MATSENGYVVLDEDTTGPPPRLRSWVIPGVDRKLLLRDGSVGFLLVHLTMWFDRVIESVDSGGLDDWGYARRQISGSSEWSNHASGTAIDLNATQHPMGVSTAKTFSQLEITRIHKRLNFFRDCIGWGGDYRSRPDAMHFEIIASLGAVERRAKTLTGSGRGKQICNLNLGAKAFILS
jgi:hypothetical protein